MSCSFYEREGEACERVRSTGAHTKPNAPPTDSGLTAGAAAAPACNISWRHRAYAWCGFGHAHMRGYHVLRRRHGRSRRGRKKTADARTKVPQHRCLSLVASSSPPGGHDGKATARQWREHRSVARTGPWREQASGPRSSTPGGDAPEKKHEARESSFWWGDGWAALHSSLCGRHYVWAGQPTSARRSFPPPPAALTPTRRTPAPAWCLPAPGQNKSEVLSTCSALTAGTRTR